MVAPPGEGIDFGESPAFKKKTAAQTGLYEAVVEEIKNQLHWRAIGVEVSGGVRSFEMLFRQGRLAVLFRPSGERCGLLDVYELPKDQGDFEAAKTRLKGVFEVNRSWRKHA